MTINPPIGNPFYKDNVTLDDVLAAHDGMRAGTVSSFEVYPMSESGSRRAKDKRTGRRKMAERSRRANRR